jgi:hypothetical protein
VDQEARPSSLQLLFTGFFAVLFGSLLGYLCVILGPDRPAVGLNLLVALLGALSGWTVGMFFSPIDERTPSVSSSWQDGGRVHLRLPARKIDPFLVEQMKRATETPSTINWVRVGLFGASALLGAVVVFVNRAYSTPAERERPQPTPSLAPPGLSTRNETGLKSA